MKYKTKVHIEIKDSNILDGHTDVYIAKLVGCSPAYISYLRSGKRIANAEFYERLVKHLTK